MFQTHYNKERVRLYPEREAIRHIVHDSYINRDYPTLNSILRMANGVFEEGRSILARLLRSMRFRYKKRENGKRYIYEQERVINQRHKYLRRMRRNRFEKGPEVYLAVIRTNWHAAPEKIWVDKDGTGGWRRPSGKGEQLKIIHAGSATGLIPNCGKDFKSKKSSDYHDEINTVHFLEWFEYTLIPNLPWQCEVSQHLLRRYPLKAQESDEGVTWQS